ncbi:unnamed protein product [Ambrosiozyma monospora]|uniref:Unnamed protein product n=1 Tax=Ambrosiozyma monospora TaxID=43982 RepID=A0ACB5TLN2_AMBMO|nr:unnamed protein product [Ambrosiozyma monospora]
MAKKGSKKSKSRQPSNPATLDPRFAQVYSDPRFKGLKNKDLKIKIDDRFSKDELNIDKSVSKVDKYGRKLTKNDKKTAFDKFYEKESDSDNEKKNEGSENEEEKDDEDDESSDDDLHQEETELTTLDRARGIGMGSDMDTTDDESSDDDSDDAKAAVEDETEQDELEIEEEKPPEGDPTSTFHIPIRIW